MNDPIQIARGEEFPRSFVPQDADCGQWEAVEPLFQSLLERKTGSAKALEQWLLDMSELEAAIDEESSRRYIAMTCATDDPEREKRYEYVIEVLQPNSKPYWHKLLLKCLADPDLERLDSNRYLVFLRGARNECEIFRQENVPLQAEDEKLQQQYQKICGAMTAQFRGEELTLPRLKPFLEETDRPTREEAWAAEAQRRLQDRDALDQLYDQMIDLRTRIARNAGFDHYMDYAFRSLQRFDYTPEDCRVFHRAVEETAVPAWRAIQKTRKKALGLTRLRPWDLAVDPHGRPPLRPFKAAEDLSRGCREIFTTVDPAFGEQFADMIAKGLLDLESRKGKAPGGYQSTLNEVRLPFIFMNAAGTDRDMYTLLHEGGHAFHALAARNEPITSYRHAPLEFCEVASFSQELLAEGKLHPFYSEEEAARSVRQHLEQIVGLFTWIAQIDAFQQWVYTHNGHSAAERRAAWLALHEKYGGIEDWSGWENWRDASWQRQLHLFICPFYYIEYGIAQLGALQVWNNYKARGGEAIRALRAAFALGGSRPLPELFRTAGAKFDFGPETLGPLVERIMKTLDRLPV